ncbi:hypothetical protein [Idiomarina sp. HP20-50]|nr:hypothetical protein [Idiomarina sp. HP20-50]MDV6316442.1 hypothetical protein [Idiomarina sp. HP20-50]
MKEIISRMCGQVDHVIEQVKKDLPADFPENVASPIFDGMRARSERLLVG